jgi:hypothetical protein
MHSSPARHAAKALTGLVVAAGLALAADAPGEAASTGEGETRKQIFSQKLPNVPGKTLTAALTVNVNESGAAAVGKRTLTVILGKLADDAQF